MSRRWDVPPLGSAAGRALDARISGVLAVVGSVLALTSMADSPFVRVYASSCIVLGVLLLALGRRTPAWPLSLGTFLAAVGIVNYAVNGDQEATDAGGQILFVQLMLQVGLLRSRREAWAQWGVLLAVYAAFLVGTGTPGDVVGQALGTVGLTLALLVYAVTWLRERVDALLAELREQANVDPLTGLLNRNGLARTGDRWRAEHGSEGRAAVLLLLDVDHFKRVNDVHGHQTGDAVLARLGRLLREECPAGAVAARLGGEEFLVVVPHAGIHEGLALAEDLRVAAGRAGGGDLPAFTVSVGVAAGRAVEDVDDLYRRADEALYRAKRGGRDRVEEALPEGAQPPAPAPASGTAAVPQGS